MLPHVLDAPKRVPPGRLARGRQLHFRQRSPAAARHFAKTQVTDASADKSLHFIPDFVKHPANLTVQALLENDAEAGRSNRLHPREPGAFAVEKDAFDAAFPQASDPSDDRA